MPSVFSTVSPLDGADLSEVTATKVDDIATILARARQAQAEWGARPIEERVRIVGRVRRRVLERAQAIAKVVREETGKPEVEALLNEVIPTGDVVSYWSDAIADQMEPIEVDLDKLSYPGKTGWIHREARGVVALIQPWNYPFALPLRTIVPALLAGNAVVFKPSEITPRTGAAIRDLFEGILPDAIFAVVQGAGDVGAALIGGGVDAVVFTGSVATGKKVAHACAESLVPCALELGGKDAAIVLADANLDRAANGVAWGALTNAGQNCAAIERVYVEEAIADKFIEKISTIVKNLGADVGPLTTDAQRAIVKKHVDEAKEKGAEILCGGEAREGKGYGYVPTLLKVNDDNIALMKDETFGPVIPIRVVKNAEEAIARANDSRYGLTASVWTKNAKRGEAIAKRLRAGVVTVNNHAFTGGLAGAPWSGVGETGWGITGSPLALDTLTRPRFILVDKNRAARELWWYPYTATLKKIALAFAVLRGGGSLGARVSALFVVLGALPKRLLGKDVERE